MPKPKKDGQRFNMFMDRNLHARLIYYANKRGQTMTLTIERILKQFLDAKGVPNPAPSADVIRNSIKKP